MCLLELLSVVFLSTATIQGEMLAPPHIYEVYLF